MKKTNKKIQAALFGETILPYALAGNFLGTIVSGVSDEGSDGDFAGSALSGAASGAATGAAFGPWGAAVGGVLGAAGGLFGASRRKRALQEKQRREDYLKNYSVARANTSSAMADYYSNYDTAMTMKEGGEVDYSPVYLNDGETVVHPDGSVKRIPKKGRKTDSVLSMEPVGSFVFGGVVDPDTNKTYADMAENMFKPTKGDSNSVYAENAKKVNKINANLLFAKLEQTKAEKGIKPKYKNLDVQAAEKGVKVSLLDRPYLDLNINGKTIALDGQSPFMEFVKSGNGGGYWRRTDTFLPSYEKLGNNFKMEGVAPELILYNQYILVKKENDLLKKENGLTRKQSDHKSSNGNIVADAAALTPVAYNFLQGTRDAEYEAPEYNMNAYPAISQLQNRYNIGRVIRDVNNAANIGYYNVNTMGNSTGAGMAQRVAIANNARRGIEDAYTKYNEVETGLGAQRAELLNSLGQQDASARVYANDINARNRAARRSFTTAAAEGFSRWGQNRALMANQKNRDLSILPYLRDYLAYGSTNQYVA